MIAPAPSFEQFVDRTLGAMRRTLSIATRSCDWVRCPGCGQSCTARYAGRLGCHRCDWIDGKSFRPAVRMPREVGAHA